MVHDNGTEFTVHTFQTQVETIGVKSVPTASKSQHPNETFKKIHQKIARIFSTTI